MSSLIPRVAAIHDLSGFGRTSLMVAIPILSAMGIQVCPLPTAVLSTHTSGFTDFCFVDLSSAMNNFLGHWKRLGLRFQAVYSGFLGSPSQVETVAACIDACLAEAGIVVVDPVLGDNGEMEPTMGQEMVERMRWLVRKADYITPNFTEAALLLDEPFPSDAWEKSPSQDLLKDWLLRLVELGPDAAVITSVPVGKSALSNFVLAYDKTEQTFWRLDYDQIPAFFPGTGDSFASVLSGSLVQGASLPEALNRAVYFVGRAIRSAFAAGASQREGIYLEKNLPALHASLPMLCRQV